MSQANPEEQELKLIYRLSIFKDIGQDDPKSDLVAKADILIVVNSGIAYSIKRTVI